MSKMEKCGQANGKCNDQAVDNNQSRTLLVKKSGSGAGVVGRSSQNKDDKLIAELKSQIPDVDNIFNLHYRIGEGTFSTVFLASLKNHEHVSNAKRKYFAVKHLIPTSHPNRVERELRCLLEIGGIDNVVGVDLCLRRSDSVAFVMPYVPHDKFHDYFSKLNARELQAYMRNLLVALRRVHSFGIIHRDVKPSNFLHDRKNQKYLLVDFGLAQTVDVVPVMANVTAAPANANNNNNTKLTQGSHGEPNSNNTNPVSKQFSHNTNSSVMMASKKRKASEIEETENSSKRSRHQSQYSAVVATTPPVASQRSLAMAAAAAATTTTAANASPPVANNGNNTTIPISFKSPLKQFNEISTPKNSPLQPRSRNNNLDSPLTRHIKSAVLGYSINTKLEQQRSNSPSPAKYSTNNRRSTVANGGTACFCYGKPTICNVCIVKKEVHASRAGTPGYRPPEVLLKYPNQTTAVDMWAIGVIMISILSSCYPFFKGHDDFTALAEMITIFGDDVVKKTAILLARHVSISQKKKPLHLRKLCVRLRKRGTNQPATETTTVNSTLNKSVMCDNCEQIEPDCLCAHTMQNVDFGCDQFPASAYDLMAKLLTIDPNQRITADEALRHPFLMVEL